MTTAPAWTPPPDTAPLTEHEGEQIERANATGLAPVVFIQRQPRPFAGKSIGDVADHFGAVIARQGAPHLVSETVSGTAARSAVLASGRDAAYGSNHVYHDA
jgi:hypothetical protein